MKSRQQRMPKKYCQEYKTKQNHYCQQPEEKEGFDRKCKDKRKIQDKKPAFCQDV